VIVPNLSSLALTQDPTAVSLVLNKNLKGMKSRDLPSDIRFITRGVNQAQKAIKLDCEQQSYEEALELYKSALTNFSKGKKYADAEMESAVRKKIEQLLERAEYIKIHLDPSYKKKLARLSISSTSSPITTTTTTTTTITSTTSSTTTTTPIDDSVLAFPSVPSHDPSRSITEKDDISQSDKDSPSSPREMAEQGIKLIEEGRIFDDTGAFKKAIGFYRAGIEYLELAVPLLEEQSKTLSEREKKRSEAFRMQLDAKIMEYKERISDLRRFIKLNKKKGESSIK